MKYPLTILCLFATFSGTHAQQKPLTIGEALSAAHANRQSIAAAKLRVTSARLSRRGLGAYPATRLFLGYQNNLAIDGAEDDLALAQPLDIFGRTSAAKAIGDAEIVRSEAELRSVLAEIQSDVFEEFSAAAAANALAKSSLQSQEIAQRLYDAIRILVDEGKLPGVQLARVGIELDRAKLAASQLNSDLRVSLHRLCGLLNLAPDTVSVQDFADISIAPIEASQLPLRRADLQLLAAEIRSAEAETRVAKLGSAPELEIQGRRSPWQQRDQQFGLRIQLGFPINDFGKARAETAAARTRAEAARKALADAIRIAESQLGAARIEMASAQEHVARYQLIVENTRALVDRFRIGFTEKAITLVELLESTRALREVEEGFVDSRLRLAKAQAAYLKACGTLLEVTR